MLSAVTQAHTVYTSPVFSIHFHSFLPSFFSVPSPPNQREKKGNGGGIPCFQVVLSNHRSFIQMLIGTRISPSKKTLCLTGQVSNLVQAGNSSFLLQYTNMKRTISSFLNIIFPETSWNFFAVKTAEYVNGFCLC